MVDLQPPERGLDRTAYVGARATDAVVGAVGALHVHAELGGDDELVAPSLERLADHRLAGAVTAVGVGGVEQGDADVLRRVEDLAARRRGRPGGRTRCSRCRPRSPSGPSRPAGGRSCRSRVDPSPAARGSSRSRSRTQKPWCSQLLVEHRAEALPHRLGPVRTAATGRRRAPAPAPRAARASRRPSHASSSAACSSRTATTSSRLGVGGRVEPLLLVVGHDVDRQPHRRERASVSPRQHRRNHESWTKTRWRRVSTGRPLVVDAVGARCRRASARMRSYGRRPSRAQLRQASRSSRGSSERISTRTGWRRSSSAST